MSHGRGMRGDYIRVGSTSFTGNTASISGGGVLCKNDCDLSQCEIEKNHSANGAGVYANGDGIDLVMCTIHETSMFPLEVVMFDQNRIFGLVVVAGGGSGLRRPAGTTSGRQQSRPDRFRSRDRLQSGRSATHAQSDPHGGDPSI